MLLTSIVDLMSHPESVAFEMNHARKVIWVVDQNQRMFSISYYRKRNMGWIKTLYGRTSGKENEKKGRTIDVSG